MRWGTSHFESRVAAIRYYRPYGYDDVGAAVDRKLAEGEIHIGKPETKPGQRVWLDTKEGRYFMEDDQ
jgi:hypothetical protein